MYDESKFGEKVYAESKYIHTKDYRDITPNDYPKSHWRTTNTAIKYLTHNLGPLLYIMNDKCVSVSALEPEAVYDPYVSIKKNGVAIFKTQKGAIIRILICFGAFVRSDNNFRIIGTRDSVETDPIKPLHDAHSFASLSDVTGSLGEKIDIPITMTSFGKDGSHGGTDRKMFLDFIKCIIEDSTPPLDVNFAINISLPGIIAANSIEQDGKMLEIPNIL